jgi:hypothetical protein
MYRERFMALAPTILDSSIAHLRILASALAEEMSLEQRHGGAAPEARACREILLTVSVLIPKLQAARHLLPSVDVSGCCSACEEE